MPKNIKKRVIYEPTGAAREYSARALNLFDGCVFGCRYCYVPLVRHMDRAKFHESVGARVTIEDIETSSRVWQGDHSPVLLCFTCDPYQNNSLAHMHLVRGAIQKLHDYGHPVAILTKAGQIAQRDFDLYRPGDSFLTTLTLGDDAAAKVWEPNAAPPSERIENLKQAKMAGIDTGVSLEPVIDPAASLEIIEATARFVDHYKTGPLNYYSGNIPVTEYDHKKYVHDFIDLAAIKYNRGIYVKKAFSICCDSPGGYKAGVQVPQEGKR